MVVAALLLGACGGDRAAAPAGVDVAALGDSITEGTNVPESERWTTFAAAQTGRRFRTCGVLGQRTDQIAQRLDECARGARTLIVQGGINDIVQGRPIEEAAENLRAMVLRGREMGMRVMLTDVLPWNNGHPAAAGRIRDLNALIRRIGRKEDVVVLRFFHALEDPAAPDRMKPEWTIDGDHPSAAGHRRLAEVVARATS